MMMSLVSMSTLITFFFENMIKQDTEREYCKKASDLGGFMTSKMYKI